MKSRSSRLTSDLGAVPRVCEDCRRATCLSGISAFRRRKAEINVGGVRVCRWRSKCPQRRYRTDKDEKTDVCMQERRAGVEEVADE